MNLQTMDGPFCMVYSFAMAMNISAESLIQEIGHDGTEIVWPELVGNARFRGHHIDEMVDVCLNHELAPVGIICIPKTRPWSDNDVKPIQSLPEQRFWNHIYKSKASVIVGELFTGAGHAVACDGIYIYDPRGMKYPLTSYNSIFKSAEDAWLIIKIDSENH